MDPQPTPSRPRAKKAPSTSSEKKKARPSAQRITVTPVSPCEDLQERIQKRAYELYLMRGPQHGSPLDDWLLAEQEILSQTLPT